MNKVLGGGVLDGALGRSPDFTQLTIPLDRVVYSVETDGTLQYWLIEEVEKVGGELLQNGLYANKTSLTVEEVVDYQPQIDSLQEQVDTNRIFSLAGL